MCGIAGIVNYTRPEDKRELLTRMVGLMHHRGPDASGLYMNGPVGLAHARLSIIDLSSAGNQPIHNEDKTVWIVFNGEIFNYPDLRKDLEAKGHRFYTQTDTEVLIHLYEEKGTDMFALLNGQFALAIWDENEQSLLLGKGSGRHPTLVLSPPQWPHGLRIGDQGLVCRSGRRASDKPAVPLRRVHLLGAPG